MALYVVGRSAIRHNILINCCAFWAYIKISDKKKRALTFLCICSDKYTPMKISKTHAESMFVSSMFSLSRSVQKPELRQAMMLLMCNGIHAKTYRAFQNWHSIIKGFFVPLSANCSLPITMTL